MAIKKVEGEMLDHENKMMEKFRKEREKKGKITFTMIKPEAVEANNIGGILKMIEDAGFRILAMKKVLLSKERTSSFYEVHKRKTVLWRISRLYGGGPIIAAILEKDNAVADFRNLIGTTNPAEAAEGTIRKIYATSMGENAVHGSDSDENAIIESDFHFSSEERF